VSRHTNRVSLASNGMQGNSDSWYPAISADGRFVAFQSWADNLVYGGSNGALDIFVFVKK
jgi:Tol biopolymer transport system component